MTSRIIRRSADPNDQRQNAALITVYDERDLIRAISAVTARAEGGGFQGAVIRFGADFTLSRKITIPSSVTPLVIDANNRTIRLDTRNTGATTLFEVNADGFRLLNLDLSRVNASQAVDYLVDVVAGNNGELSSCRVDGYKTLIRIGASSTDWNVLFNSGDPYGSPIVAEIVVYGSRASIIGHNGVSINTAVGSGANRLAANKVSSKTLHASDVDADQAGTTGGLTALTGFAQGGNSFGAVARLGTNDGHALELETNNTLALSLDTTQNAAFYGATNFTRKNHNGNTILGVENLNNSAASAAFLHVSGGATNFFQLFQGGPSWSTSGPDVRNGGATVLISYNNIPMRFMAHGSGGFTWTNGFNMGFNHLMKLDSSGNLVIGADVAAAAKLDVRGSVVINENGDNADTRIEGDNDTHCYFLDASADCNGFGEPAPTVKVSVNGGLGTKSSNVSLDSASPTLTVGNTSFIRLALGASSSGNITLSDGLYDGQYLIIRCSSNLGTAVIPNNTAQNVRLTADWNPTTYDLLELVWDSTDGNWLERCRSTL